ncbi:MAG: TatD family hydrolase [Candidatus Micrarchaeota archaeon]|nr:TatD family hydrolase [Candidatus Micrarchaeota archaeon]
MPDSDRASSFGADALLPLVFDVHAHHPAAWGRTAAHRFVAAGFSPSSNTDVISAIASCPRGWMALGLGPQEIQRADRYPDPEAAISQVEEQARTVRAHPALSSKLVAIGEVGLDNHWGQTPADRARQFAAFERMIALARSLDLPLVIHSRDAEGDCVKQLLAASHLHAAQRGSSAPHLRVLMHCFGGTLEQARACADAGWLVSIPPVPSKERKKIIAALPLSSLVVESDAPYIGKESGSGALKSAEMIAKYQGISLEEAARATARNAQAFFRL